MPSEVDGPLNRSAIAGPRSSLTAYFSAISNSRRSKPSDGHSTASDLATNTNGEVQTDAAAGSRDVVAALADGDTALTGQRAPTED